VDAIGEALQPAPAAMCRREFLATVDAGSGRPGDEAEGTITTLDLDHYNDQVFPQGADLRAYRKNPIVLFLHDPYEFVGSAMRLERTNRSIRARWRWLAGDAFAARVKNAWEQGVVRGLSIGFKPLESKDNRFAGKDFLRWQLLEFSIVPIPANPEARRDPEEYARQLKTFGLPAPVSSLQSLQHEVVQRIARAVGGLCKRPAPAFQQAHLLWQRAVRASEEHRAGRITAEDFAQDLAELAVAISDARGKES
jgi:HK97 family phage prohead protease